MTAIKALRGHVGKQGRSGRALALPVALALVCSLAACGVSDLDFVQDERVAIVEPRDRAKVDLPVTVRWTAEDFDGRYAVFVDRAPVPPGHSLAWLARDDDICKTTPGCPDEAWLNGRWVFPTAATELTLERLPELTRDERRVFHEVTVVLLDENDERIGESAFSVEFEVERDRR